jgi:CHRD domain
MKNARFLITCAELSLAAMLSINSVASAETLKFKANLKSAEEVPANDSKGTGTLDATYDTSSKQLSYTADYSGLTGSATMAHFHGPADPGKNAGILIPVQGSVASPIKGTATLTDAQVADLMAGKMYFNVHTEKNKGGEIRGQVTNAANTRSTTNPGAPVEGRNSFTEGQAKSRIEASGFADVSGLQKDDTGVWRGKAKKDGKTVDIALDFQGNVVAK